jgi:hypothetical protein
MSCWNTRQLHSCSGCRWQLLLLLLLLRRNRHLPSILMLLLLVDAVCHPNHATRNSVGTQIDDVPGQHRWNNAVLRRVDAAPTFTQLIDNSGMLQPPPLLFVANPPLHCQIWWTIPLGGK